MQRKHAAAFTLIEVLIAILIFGIGTITLLRAIIFFVSSGDEVRQKAIWILLAKEAIDIVYNQRDTNLRRSVRWDCAHIDVKKPDACAYRFEAWKTYRVEFNGLTGYDISMPTPATGNNALYLHTVNGINLYSHIATDTVSPFSRYIEFAPAELGWINASDSSHVLKMTVYVQYMPGDRNRKVILESLLSAWEKDR